MKLQLYKGIVCLIIDSNRRERERERERDGMEEMLFGCDPCTIRFSLNHFLSSLSMA